MIEEIKKDVEKLLANDNSGHRMDHINRVLNLSLKFAEKENADEQLVSLIALLHDVDDYKLFGKEAAENLTNAKRIMEKYNIPNDSQNKIIALIKTIGYSKRLNGIVPTIIEAKIVSDADMCDGLGATGILRTYAYNTKHGHPFFNRNIFPRENLTTEKYTTEYEESSVCHIFEKILKLKKLMLTKSGKEEAENRHQIVVDFLRHFFDEENAPEWNEYLEEYLAKQKIE